MNQRRRRRILRAAFQSLDPEHFRNLLAWVADGRGVFFGPQTRDYFFSSDGVP